MTELSDLSLYIHWPFCRSKCPYCDFFSRVAHADQETLIADYLQQLTNIHERLPQKRIISVFFGGGTPSLILPQNIERVLTHCTKLWSFAPQVEISLEANPNTRTPTLFADMAHAGINRLSLGIQSLQDTELKFLGRTHTAAQARQAIDDVLTHFNNHSVDLMYALPNQSAAVWSSELKDIISLGLKHISLYQLTIEEGTVFAKKHIKPLDEDHAAELYTLTEEILATRNYHKYEVSNYAQPNYECRHNLVYWQGGNYAGIGLGAHGRFTQGGIWYAQTVPFTLEKLTNQERAEELLLMGLRLTSGINKQTFRQLCGISLADCIRPDFLQTAIAQGLLLDTPTTLQATAKGFLVLDYLIENLCA